MPRYASLPAGLALLVALAFALATGDRAQALDIRTASGPEIAVAVADGDLGVLKGREARRRAGIYGVSTRGMSPTLGVGDLVVVDRAAYRTGTPARGDVVVFTPDDAQSAVCGSESDRVARIVGLPGEVVRLDALGVEVAGARLQIAGAGRPAVTRTFAAVPPGKVLVIGDNPRESCDSAVWKQPFVAVSALRGKVEGVFWPRGRAGILRGDGGADPIVPAGPARPRLDAYVALARAYAFVNEAFDEAAVCDLLFGGCDGVGRRSLADEVRRQRARLDPVARGLRGDCAAPPLSRALDRLGRDQTAVRRGRVGLDRLARRLDYHFLTGLSGMRTCWGPAASAQAVSLLR